MNAKAMDSRAVDSAALKLGAKKVLSIAIALARRPDLLTPAARAAVRFLPDAPLRRGPIPSSEYLSYRLKSVYGAPFAEIPAEEFIKYLEWCKKFPNQVG